MSLYLRARRPRDCGSISDRDRYFSSVNIQYQFWYPLQDLSPKINCLERVTEKATPSNAEVEISGVIPPLHRHLCRSKVQN